uniref:Nuclear pore complex protein Nup153 n=1 Tax=Evadne anonyx TaxID=141404 RepID=A0A9N6WQ33_9CRUS|nr:EOG090X078K [Evadne anonyx]
MFRNKKDVDRHVQDLLKKANKDIERKLLGYNFAKLYNQVGEHKIARQYISSFLSIKESSAHGHRLAGLIAVSLGEIEAAVSSYKRSFDLNPNQKDLVFETCHLVCELPPTTANRDLQQCWLERAEAIQPHHSVVFKLKHYLLHSSKNASKGEVEDFLNKEMAVRPSDMSLRIQLLKLYLSSNRIDEAYDHMLKIESLQVFRNELDWYKCGLDVIAAYETKMENHLNQGFFSMKLNIVEHCSFLKLMKIRAADNPSKVLIDVISHLLLLDETLLKASAKGMPTEALVHFTCQLYFQAGLALLQKAQAGLDEELQALSYASALFAITYNQERISVMSNTFDEKLVEAWKSSASYRQSQCGHCIVAWEAREGRKWLVETVKKWDNADGKKKIFSALFFEVSASTSCRFAESFEFPRHEIQLPSFNDLLGIDQIALKLNQHELHHIIWTGVRYFTMQHRKNDAEFVCDFSQILSKCQLIRDIPFAAASWKSTALETLSALDVEAFIYAVIYCHVSQEEASRSKVIDTFPASLTKCLCTDQQVAWWQAVVKVITGTGNESMGELRRTIQRGLDVIRLSANNHGIPLELVAKLARSFMARAGKARSFPTVEVPPTISTDILSVVQTEALEACAGRYWKILLEMASSGNRFLPTSGRLFEFRSGDVEMDVLFNEAKLFTGYHMWRAGRKEEAQRTLHTSTDPYASYYHGLILKELAEEELRKGVSLYESRSAANMLLNKAKDSLYVTLDRLRSPRIDRFHPLDRKLAEVIERVELKLESLVNVSVTNGHSTDEFDESEDKEFTTPQQVTSTPFRRSLADVSSLRSGGGSRLDGSAARVEARPSPERLDAQLRQMVLKQEECNLAISNELKQIRNELSSQEECNLAISNELKQIRSEVVDIKSLIQKLESHLEMQTKQESKMLKKSEEQFPEIYGASAYDEEEEEWDEGEEDDGNSEEIEAAAVSTYNKLRGKLKVVPPNPSVSMPLYNPPFVPPSSNRFPMTHYGQFPPNPYAQYPNYPGYMGVPPGGAYSIPHGYNYPWDVQQPPIVSPGPFIAPGMAVPSYPPQMTPSGIAPAVHPPSSLMNTHGVAPLVESSLPPSSSLPAQTPTKTAASEADDKRPSTAETPHVFQIVLPPSSAVGKTLDKSPIPSTLPKTPNSLFASIPEPQFSSVTTDKGTKTSPLKPGRDRKVSSCSDASYAPEEEADIEFKPIIPLPEEIEVLTGEEGEEVLFDQPSKLFRFSENEWKERGSGHLKLLQNPKTKKVRLVMRREQVLKICANHFVTPEIKLTEMKSSKNSWIWAAMDHADGEGRLEKFAARFKTAELANEFQQAFEKAKTVTTSTTTTTSTSDAQATKPAKPDQPSEPMKGFGNKFAPKSGTWTCETCYITNQSEVDKCPACETLKPGATPKTIASPLASFKFDIPAAAASGSSSSSTVTATSSLGFKFGVPVTAASNSSATTPIPTTGSSNGIMPKSGLQLNSSPAAVAVSTTSGFNLAASSTMATIKFGVAPASAPSSGFSLGPTSQSSSGLVSEASKIPSVLPASGFTFGASKPSFSFGSTVTASTAAPIPTGFSLPPSKLGLPKTESVNQTSTTAAVAATVPTPASASVFPSFGTPKSATDTGVSFGGTFSKAPFITPVDTAKPTVEKIDDKPGQDKPFAGFTFNLPGMLNKKTEEKTPDFSILSSMLTSQKATGFTVNPDAEFAGAGSKLFNAPAATTDDQENEEDAAEYEPNVAFEPVVPLPELVEVTTGEEDEDALFSDRSFLYRYDQETKEWKEKGRGDMKILKHKTSGRVRLLMRREQVLKICCNHYISPQLSLQPLQTSERSWTWTARDFSEGELVQETLALKFKTKDQAQKFKKVFDEAQSNFGNESVTPTKSEDVAKKVSDAKVEPKTQATQSLAELFKPKEGSWECQGCFCRNDASALICPSCETAKTGTSSDAAATPVPSSTLTGFSFSAKGFSFTLPPKSSTASTAPTASVPIFGAQASTGTSFGGFSFSLPAPSKAEVKTQSPNVSVSSQNEYYEEEENDAHFEPVIPLPDKIEVKTGEEDEETLYCHRSKLLRLHGGEWKERGVGDIKILRHAATGKVRLLMRRDQVFKICLNHGLTSDIKFLRKDDRSWLWAAQDFSEGEGITATFVLRFRDATIAESFMQAVDNSQSSSTTDEDVEIVFLKEATEEQKRKAIELKLPLNFFTYETAPPCSGCRGCDKEDGAFGVNSAAAKPVKSTPINMFAKLADSAVSHLSFSALATDSTSGFNKPSQFSWSGTGQPIFGGCVTQSSKAAEDENGEDEDEEPESNDPHFEPIIPLPALVQVTTGEEDEDVVFTERAKLYRFDSSVKEWKEKGVGSMKILNNKEKNTFRILLRREQIHKLACNHWLTTDLALKPLSTSLTTWTWFAMDFSQGELLLEQFAARFKTEDMASLFRSKVVECQEALRKNSVPVEPVVSTPSAAKIVPKTTEAVLQEKEEEKEENENDDGEEEEEEEEEDYEDVEESIMFEKRCTLSSLEIGACAVDKTWILLGTGNLKILYDDEMLCARIVVEKDGAFQYLCDNVVAIETELKVDGKECVWSAIDYSAEESVHRTFRAQFASINAALEFQSIFAEGKQFAEKSDVHDEPDIHAAGYDHNNDIDKYEGGKF